MTNDRIEYGLPGAYEPTPEEIERAMRNAERERARIFGEVARALNAWLARIDHARASEPMPVHVAPTRSA
jgi:hypothetical protein